MQIQDVVHHVDQTTLDGADGADTDCGLWIAMDLDFDHGDPTTYDWSLTTCNECLSKNSNKENLQC